MTRIMTAMGARSPYALLPPLFMGLLFSFYCLATGAEEEQGKRPEFSEAERLIFLTDHLSNIREPGALTYEFVRSGNLEQKDNFTDRVLFRIRKVLPDGFKSGDIDFLQGDRNRYIPPNEHTNTNGVILVFLQRDIYEMARLTPGSSRYFQKRLKYGFAYEADVQPVHFTYDGSQVEGRAVTVRPYINDPHRPEFEEYAHKVYTFLFSDQVPGMLYQIHTVIPDMSKEEEGKAFEQPLIEEKLTLVKAEFGKSVEVAQQKP